MSKAKKIIVISRSFLLASGIESLALEIPGLLVEKIFSGGEKRLLEKILDSKPDYIIIDPDSVSDILITLLRDLDKEPDIVIIGLVSESVNENVISKFSRKLDANDNKFKLIEDLQAIVGKDDGPTDSEQIISKRETEILRYLVIGLTNQEVADKLFLSVHTVMTHRKKITKKLGIKTVSGLTVYALMNNIVDIREVERNT